MTKGSGLHNSLPVTPTPNLTHTVLIMQSRAWAFTESQHTQNIISRQMRSVCLTIISSAAEIMSSAAEIMGSEREAPHGTTSPLQRPQHDAEPESLIQACSLQISRSTHPAVGPSPPLSHRSEEDVSGSSMIKVIQSPARETASRSGAMP